MDAALIEPPGRDSATAASHLAAARVKIDSKSRHVYGPGWLQCQDVALAISTSRFYTTRRRSRKNARRTVATPFFCSPPHAIERNDGFVADRNYTAARCKRSGSDASLSQFAARHRSLPRCGRLRLPGIKTEAQKKQCQAVAKMRDARMA